jgi:hypothetical protein
MSSRIAVCGQQPVSTAVIRSDGQHCGGPQGLGVLGSEDVVGDDDERSSIAQQRAQCSNQRRLAAAHWASDPDAQRATSRVGRGLAELAVAVVNAVWADLVGWHGVSFWSG